MPAIEIEDKCDGCGECVNVCPRNVLKMEGGKAKVVDALACSICNLCTKACGLNAVSVSETEDTFIMSMETDGSYTSDEMVISAAKVLKQKAEEFEEVLAGL